MPRDVQELMGHKTIAMTRRYPHLAPSHQLEAVRRLDVWGRKRPLGQNPSGTRSGTETFEAKQAEVETGVEVIVQ
jgi:hypothetical protein